MRSSILLAALLLSFPAFAGVTTLPAFPIDGQKASYSASTTTTPPTTATDLCVLTGSSTKTVRVTSVRLSGTGTTAISVSVQLILRSSADSAGTSTSITAVSHDSNNAAATATVRAYTANPTLGTTVGSIRTDKVPFPLTGGTALQTVWMFGDHPAQTIVLRGATQQLAINMNSTTVAGGSIACAFEWTEE